MPQPAVEPSITPRYDEKSRSLALELTPYHRSILDEPVIDGIFTEARRVIESHPDATRHAFDFQHVENISSYFFAAGVIRLANQLAHGQRRSITDLPLADRLGLIGIDPSIHDFLKITRLDSLYPIYNSRDEFFAGKPVPLQAKLTAR